jgi:hypothetical protein
LLDDRVNRCILELDGRRHRGTFVDLMKASVDVSGASHGRKCGQHRHLTSSQRHRDE